MLNQVSNKPQKHIFINLTQHELTTEQIEEIDTKGFEIITLSKKQEKLKELITFDELPSQKEMNERADAIANLVLASMDGRPVVFALIGGAPYFQSTLERRLMSENITPVYAFSQRQSVEGTDEDGNVRKVAVFRHQGFIVMEKLTKPKYATASNDSYGKSSSI